MDPSDPMYFVKNAPAFMIEDAVNLFVASPTGQGRKQHNFKADVEKVIRRLQREIREGDITYVKMHRDSLGEAKNGRIRLNDTLQNSVLLSSLVLVHEATHLALANLHPIDQELIARRLEVLYRHDFLNGRWSYKTHGGTSEQSPKPGTGSSFQYFDDELPLREKLDNRHQLIDYILNANFRDAEANYRNFVDAKWVVHNINFWGGLDNRWPGTKGIYVAKLAQVQPDLTLRICQSVLNQSPSGLPLDFPTAGAGFGRHLPTWQCSVCASPDFSKIKADFLEGVAGKKGEDTLRKVLKPLYATGKGKQVDDFFAQLSLKQRQQEAAIKEFVNSISVSP